MYQRCIIYNIVCQVNMLILTTVSVLLKDLKYKFIFPTERNTPFGNAIIWCI